MNNIIVVMKEHVSSRICGIIGMYMGKWRIVCYCLTCGLVYVYFNLNINTNLLKVYLTETDFVCLRIRAVGWHGYIAPVAGCDTPKTEPKH